ncbi:ISL3 family transposase [Bacillus cereus]|uniref:ISL3 family transposase n=2 Tax=Bacillaceae TaxID=186817 RepID=UPI0022B7DF98|nr:ISL3 family transposase [Bacillus cereus]
MTKVCIDDFAIKKGHRYGTIMVNIETHKIVDLIPSRDLEDVTVWLKTFPHLEIVSRDGSVTFRNAITAAHPTAIQVNDRFHLVKNVMDYIKKYFQRLLPTSIQINSPLVDEINPAYSLLTRKEKIVIAQKLQKKKIPISRIAKELAMDIRTLQKYIHLPKHQLSTLFMTKFERERFENIQRKKQIIKQVKKLHSEGMSIRKIAVYVHLDRRTVRRYIKENLRTISVQTRSGRTTKINSYLEHMITYMQKGYSSKKIHDHLVLQGYTGSVSTTRYHIRLLKKQQNIKKPFFHSIPRQKIIRLIFNPAGDPALKSQQIEEIFELYPSVQELLTLLYQFQTILAEKQYEKLSEWILKAEKLSIPEVDSFLHGIKRDFESVLHACKYPYSNGLAEGSVNKTKLIKRIMYGRNNFDILRKKILLREFNQYGKEP